MVDWLAGKRVKGTSTERTASFIPSVGGWKELGRITASGAETTLNVTSLANKRYLMVLSNIFRTGGSMVENASYNSITSGGKYARKNNDNGGTDYTGINENVMDINFSASSNNRFTIEYIANYSTKEKLSLIHAALVGTTGAGTAPLRNESAYKLANTTDAISSIQKIAATSSFATPSEVVVLGWDTADTHTTNFWTELASVNATGSTTSFDSGVFTAKKYLWIQGYVKSTTGQNVNIRVGNTTIDSGGNYSMRRSSDGGADNLQTSFAAMAQLDSANAQFFNLFIVNNATNEKLGIGHSVAQSTAGAGTAPSRTEFIGKWANTANQINIIQFLNNAGSPTNYTSASTMKVWGSD